MAKDSVAKYRRPNNQIAGASEIGRSGLKEYAGLIREESIRELQGTDGIKIYKQMRDNDSIIGAILFAVSMLIRQASWSVSPFEEGNESDKAAADFVQSCLDDMSMTWQDVLTEILTMLPFGWAYLETVYKRRDGFIPGKPGSSSKYTDGKMGWRKLPLRPQDTLHKWEFDDTGGIQGMWQRIPGGKPSVFIPIGKGLLFRTEATKNNPEGRSVLRNSYTPWYFKKRIMEIEGVGIERDLAGLPVMQAPDGFDIFNPDNPEMVTARREAELVVRNIRRDEQEGIVLPFGWELTLLSTGGKRNFDTSEIISRYDTAMAMTVLADFIILGHNNRYGSFALAGSKTHMFGVAIGGWLDSIKAVFNRYAIPRLLEINGMDGSRPPKLGYSDIEIPDLDALGKYIANLQKAGFKMFPNIPLEKKLLEYANLPTEGVKLGQEAVDPATDPKDPNADPDAEDEDKEDVKDTPPGKKKPVAKDNAELDDDEDDEPLSERMPGSTKKRPQQ